jgi:hypothetical protein
MPNKNLIIITFLLIHFALESPNHALPHIEIEHPPRIEFQMSTVTIPITGVFMEFHE